MMRWLLFLVLIPLLAQDQPKPIPAERHEEISRLMLAVQAANLEVQAAQQRYEQASKAYNALLAKLQKEFGAPDCSLSLDKEWVCQPKSRGN